MRLVFEPEAFRQLQKITRDEPRLAQKVFKLIEAIQRDPFNGPGKPEPLRYELSGYWSRRISQQHRLVYEVVDEEIIVRSCLYHYD